MHGLWSDAWIQAEGIKRSPCYHPSLWKRHYLINFSSSIYSDRFGLFWLVSNLMACCKGHENFWSCALSFEASSRALGYPEAMFWRSFLCSSLDAHVFSVRCFRRASVDIGGDVDSIAAPDLENLLQQVPTSMPTSEDWFRWFRKSLQ